MFSWSVTILKILGFKIKIDPSWLLIAALIIWSLSSDYFPETTPGLSGTAYVVMAVAATLLLYSSLILHELAHSLVARRYGVEIEGITLFIFGGVAELKSEPRNAGSEFWIAIAGPVTSFFLAAGFWFLSFLGGLAGYSGPVITILGYLAALNLTLALFNLIPAFPLDGGRIYRAILWNKSGNLVDATLRAARLGSVFAYVLIGLGLVSLFSGSTIGGLWPILIGLFLLAAAKTSFQHVLTQSALEKVTVGSIMTREPWTTDPKKSLSDLVNDIMLPHSITFVPVVEEGQLLGYIDGQVLRGMERENWTHTCVDDVFEGLSDQNRTTADTPAAQLLERIGTTGRRKFLVTEGDTLVGVVTLSDLAAHLNVLQQIGATTHTMGMALQT